MENKINTNTNLVSGFSLLELLIYISILSIIIVVVSNTFISISRGRGQVEARSEVDYSISYVVELMRQDLKNASIVSSPSHIPSGNSCTPNFLGSNTANVLVLTRGGVVITYDVVGGVLRRAEGISTPVDLTDININVSTPIFTRIENTNSLFCKTYVTIKINLTFSYNSTSPDFVYSTNREDLISLYQYN